MSDTMRIPVPLRWGDVDQLGHINNVQFARLLEECRVRAITEWFGADRRQPVLVARQEIEYVAPMYYTADPAECEIWISRIGGSSFDFGCRLFAADGTLCALAETTVTTIDASTGRPAPFDDAIRAVLETHGGPPVELRRRRTTG